MVGDKNERAGRREPRSGAVNGSGAIDGFSATVLRSEQAAQRARVLVASSEALLDRAKRAMDDTDERTRRAATTRADRARRSWPAELARGPGAWS